jgi:hypothetical protein
VLISRDGTRQFATEGNQIHVSSDFFVTAVSNTLPGVLTGRQPRLACSADGTRLVAVGSAALFTSSDGGVLWTSHGLGVTLEVCAMSADGTKMIGLGAGKTFVSTNGGLSFQIVHSDPSKQWSSVAISASGDYALACEDTGFIYLSTDFGTTWLPLETSRRWRAVTISDDGTKLAAVETGAPPTPIFTFDTKPQSTAGTAGSLSGGPHSAVELVYAGNGLFVVTGSQGLVTPQ